MLSSSFFAKQSNPYCYYYFSVCYYHHWDYWEKETFLFCIDYTSGVGCSIDCLKYWGNKNDQVKKMSLIICKTCCGANKNVDPTNYLFVLCVWVNLQLKDNEENKGEITV